MKDYVDRWVLCLLLWGLIAACGAMLRTAEVAAGAAAGGAVGGPPGAAVGAGIAYVFVENTEQAKTIEKLELEVRGMREAIVQAQATGKPVVLTTPFALPFDWSPKTWLLVIALVIIFFRWPAIFGKAVAFLLSLPWKAGTAVATRVRTSKA